MTAIKEVPTNFRVYYTSMKNTYAQKRNEAIKKIDSLTSELTELYNFIVNDIETNKQDYAVNLKDYKEFVENKYIDGQFLRVAKGILINKKGDYELIGKNYDIYKIAELQKTIYDIEKNITLYNKLLNITLKEYQQVVKAFYEKVQEKMILDGCGYVFDGMIGWICINRIHLTKTKPHIDYAATKLRKKQLREEGKKIYNKEEAEWCEKNGFEYKAEDGRVFQKIEYVYEIPLIGCKLPNGKDIKFKTSDYRGRSVRGKTNADLYKLADGDKHKICKLDIDIRTKLYLSLDADKTLYSKFIRNENQKASVVKPTDRKN